MQAVRSTFMLVFALVFATVLSLVAFTMTGDGAKEARAESASREYGPFTCQLPDDGDLKICAEGIRVPYGGGVGREPVLSRICRGAPSPSSSWPTTATKTTRSVIMSGRLMMPGVNIIT